MAAKIPKRERLMNLVAVLLASSEPVPFRDIAGRVIGYDDPAGDEALEKRFDRDKADLRRLGIPIEYVAGDDGQKAGYVIRKEEVFQQRVIFTPQESMLLSIAGRVGAAATGGGPLEEALKGALRKLAVDLVGPDPLDGVTDIAVLRSRSGDPTSLARVTTLSQAVTANRRVRFAYEGISTGERTVREVDPYGLGLVRGAWYLVGWCHLRTAVRVFKVARLSSSVELIGPEDRPVRFQVPHDFKLEDHLTFDAWDQGDDAPVTVRFLAKPGITVGDAMPGVVEIGSQGGRTLMELEVRRPSALVPWVLSMGGGVQILSPESLREEVANEARQLLGGYRPAADAVVTHAAIEGEAS